MKRIILLAFICVLSAATSANSADQKMLGSGDRNLLSDSENHKKLEKDQTAITKKNDDREKLEPKATVKKKLVKKAGAAAVTTIATKKAIDAVTDKIKD